MDRPLALDLASPFLRKKSIYEGHSEWKSARTVAKNQMASVRMANAPIVDHYKDYLQDLNSLIIFVTI
jgi:cell fate (sporulation/competence/biofilm development) regulator YmcA (YheA/YmcA/DUF963 family)